MKQVLRLVKKDIIRFLKDRPAILLTFAVPILLILIFGNIFGGSRSSGKVNVIFVNESNSKIAKLIESKLDSSKSIRLVKEFVPDDSDVPQFFDEETAKQFIKEGKVSAAVVIPEDFFADTSSSIKFKYYYDPKNEIESSIIQGTIQQTIMTQIPRAFPVLMQRQANKFLGDSTADSFREEMAGVIGEYFNVPADSVFNFQLGTSEDSILEDTGSSASGNIMNELVKFESEQLVGQDIQSPGVTRTVGGWAVMFLLFSITGAATSLFEEIQEGSLKRLMCMPLKKSHILWSKYIYSVLLGIVQLMSMFIFAWIVFNVDIFSNFGNLLLVIISSSAAAVSFGMIITAFAKSLNQANGIATLLILVMSAVGGAWFPVSLLPDWMQIISKFTITYWSVEGFLQVLWRQADFMGIAVHILILLSIAFLVNFYSVIRFKSGKVF